MIGTAIIGGVCVLAGWGAVASAKDRDWVLAAKFAGLCVLLFAMGTFAAYVESGNL